MATLAAPTQTPLQGFTSQGYRNADGSVGTRNLLAISTTVQGVAGVLDVAVQRIRDELLPQFPNVDGVVPLEHAYGCGVAIAAPGAEIPIRTLRGKATVAQLGELMFRHLLDVASGRRTWAEHWKLHNALVLFNPAPVT